MSRFLINKSKRSLAVLAPLAAGVIVAAIYSVIIFADRRIHVVYNVPENYRGFFAIVYDPRPDGQVSQVSEAGSWRDREFIIAVPDGGIVILDHDDFLRSWHRSRVSSSDLDIAKAGDLFFREDNTTFYDNGARVHWMFYGTKEDYDRQRNRNAIAHRIDDIEATH